MRQEDDGTRSEGETSGRDGEDHGVDLDTGLYVLLLEVRGEFHLNGILQIGRGGRQRILQPILLWD